MNWKIFPSDFFDGRRAASCDPAGVNVDQVGPALS